MEKRDMCDRKNCVPQEEARMDALRGMDRRFRKYGEGRSQLLDGLFYLGVAVLEVCLLFPFGQEFHAASLIAAVAGGVAVKGALSPSLYCMEEGKNISVYRKLRFTPVARGTLVRYHMGILMRHLIRTFVPGLLLQLLGNYLWDCWAWENFLFLAFVAFLLPLGMGLWDVWWASRSSSR